MALAQGASYEQAAAAGQYALDSTEQYFKEQLYRGMQVPDVTDEEDEVEEDEVEEDEAEEEDLMSKKLRLVQMREAEERKKVEFELKKLRMAHMRDAVQQEAQAEEIKKMRMREAQEKKLRLERQKMQAEEMEQMRIDAKYEAMVAEMKKPKFVPQQPQKPKFVPVETPALAAAKPDYKTIMEEYAAKKAQADTFVVDNGVKTKEVVLTPPEDAVVEPPVEEEEYVIDNGVQTDAVVVSAAHHKVEAVKDTKGKVHTFTHDTMHNKINVPEGSQSYLKSVVAGLGLAVTTGALVMLALRSKNSEPQGFSGDAPLIENAFGDDAMLNSVDVEAPPLNTWASSAVCRALESVEPPTFDIATPRQ
jgi:hypothetical protein